MININCITFYEPSTYNEQAQSALEQLNLWDKEFSPAIICINSKGGGRVSKDTDICYSKYLEVWYREIK